MTSKQKFGFWSIVLLGINSIIGTGIFLTPQEVMLKAGKFTPIVYIIAAFFAIILAITFSSASKYVNKNGAAYAYSKAGFGDNIGFYVGITRFVAAAIAWGVMATAVVKTSFSILYGSNELSTGQITIGFVILMLILLGINLSGTYVLKIFSNISTVGKVAALVIAIVAGGIIFVTSGTNHFSEVNSLVDIKMNLTTMTGAIMAAFYAFTGFESIASAASEMENPEKNLPRAIPLAIFIIAVIYVCIVGIGMIINPDQLIHSKEVVVLASIFDNQLIKSIIIYGALVSMFGINIAASFGTPRVFEAISNEGQIPKFFSQKNKNGVPVLAFIITAALAILIPMSFQYDMKGIMVISSVSRFIQFLVVPLAVIGFYYGKSAEALLKTAKKSLVLDVCIPVVAFLTSLFLLIKFDWVGQFSIQADDGGSSSLNYYAISSMIIGYIVLPLVLKIYNDNYQSKVKI